MSGLFGAKKSQSTTPVRLNAIQVNQSAYGNAIPLLYGTSRLPITLLDYVDFKSTAQTQSGGKGGGSSTTTGYTYAATIIAALCEGPITGVSAVYMDKAQTTLAAQNMTLFLGSAGQPAWTYMVNNHPTHALPYDHLAYVAAPNFDLGSSAGLPNLTFEVTGLLPYTGLLDAEPSAIITDYCTDPNHGVGFPYIANLTGTNSFQAYCVAMGFFISPSETTQRQAQDFLNEILQVTNSQAVWTAGTGLRIVPYQDQAVTGNGSTYTPNLTPIYSFNDNDYVYEQGQPPVKRSITPANETFNVWRVEFLDRANQYNTAIEEFRDEVDVSVNGLRVASTVTLHSITTRPVAKMVAALLCLRNINIRSTFTWKVRADYSLLEPMDLVAINDSIGGITNQLVRITEVNDDENDFFTITAEEMMVGPASAPLYDTQLAAGYAANYGADPGSVVTPYIFTIPPMLVSASGGYELGIAVAGSGAMWGGCDVWASLDNVSYDHVGIIGGPARVGNILATLPAGSDPDTANTVSVQLNQSTPLVINSGTRADADNFRTLCIVDGEIISYQNSTALGNNAFSLSYLRRNAYGSTNAAHGVGTQFAVLDKAIFRMPFDPGLSGQPVWFKFASFNIFGGGNQNLSAVTAYQGFFQGQNGGQLLPNGDTPLNAQGSIVNVGTRLYKKPNSVSAWDSNCYSIDAFAGGCTLKFTVIQPAFIMGLTDGPHLANASYTSILYAWYPAADGTAYIYESGSLVFPTRPYTSTDFFEIRYDGKYISYYLSGVVWRQVPAPGLVLFMDASFYTPGSAAQNIYFGSLNPANSSPFVARGQCKVSDESFTKVGGVSAWDSDIYSLEGYPNAHISFKANQTNADFMIGFSINPSSDLSFTTVNCAFDCTATGTIRAVLGGGANIDTGVTYTTSDLLGLTYDGTTVTWLKNGVSVYSNTLAASVGAALAPPGTPVFLDSSFFTPGAGANTVQFGPTTQFQLSDTSQIGLGAATETHIAAFTAPGSITVPTGFGNNVSVVLVSGAAPLVDSTVIITVTISAASITAPNPGNGSAELFAYYQIYKPDGTLYTQDVGTGATAVLTNTATGYVLQAECFAAAGLGAGYTGKGVLFIENLISPTGAVTVNIGAGSAQMEYIKR